jgi:glycolate oxidase subunit GlcD
VLTDPIERDLASIVGRDAVLRGAAARPYLSDATEAQGLIGRADAVCLPASVDEVQAVLAWCYAHDVAVVPRGGGTGYAGGAVPIDGGVVVALGRLDGVDAFDPFEWRIRVKAGLITARLKHLVRQQGLWFPPDPGAAETSHIGGNIATNAGGPHAFKYGVTGNWVMGIEAVVPPGDRIEVGGPIRKDVAGYDLKSLLTGSEGTLGIITAAWIRLIPAPEAALPIVGFYPDELSGCEAIQQIVGTGLAPATLEYLDASTLAAAGATFPGGIPRGAAFLLVAEADGSLAAATALRDELQAVLSDNALDVRAPSARTDVEALWNWREGVSIAVTTMRGGKLSEDIVVPVEQISATIAEIHAVGRKYRLPTCSWGHAGDGNLHATFMLSLDDAEELERVEQAARELLRHAVSVGGSISGEHGTGWVKRGELARQWHPRAIELHEQIKLLFDPKGLLNPGKKTA